MSRPKGSIIGARPTWTTTATSGIWTLRQAEEMAADGKWPRGPVAPTSLAGTGGDQQVALTWVAPSTTHGTITDYEVEYTAPYIEAGDQYWANVALLLPLDGIDSATTFTDASTNAISVTRSNQTVISTAQSKFGGASAFFDGAGDRLNISNAAIAPGEGDFAVEFWLRASAVNANKVLYAFAADADPGIWLRSNGTIAFYYNSGVYAASAAISANTWYHIAVSRASGVVRVFVDGVPSSTTYTFTSSITSTSASIGGVANFDAGTLSGYIDDFRLTVGSARGYTAAFTPPSAAHPANGNAGQAAVNQTVRTGSASASYTLTGLTNDTEYTIRVAAVNHTRGDWSDSVAVTPSAAATDPDFASVSLLLPFDGNWSDLSNNSYTVTPTSASTSATKFKFGTESAYFTGSGYAELPGAAHPSGTEDWTIEYWADSDNWAGGTWMRHFGTESRYGTLRVYSSSNSVTLQVISISNTIMGAAFSPVSGWNHFAFVRQGNTIRAYVNGAQVGSGSFTFGLEQPIGGGTPGWRLGMWTGNTLEGFVGYIDEFRVTRGVCRYPDGTTFTPPTAAFPTQ